MNTDQCPLLPKDFQICCFLSTYRLLYRNAWSSSVGTRLRCENEDNWTNDCAPFPRCFVPQEYPRSYCCQRFLLSTARHWYARKSFYV